jgi:hypothetical protein
MKERKNNKKMEVREDEWIEAKRMERERSRTGQRSDR